MIRTFNISKTFNRKGKYPVKALDKVSIYIPENKIVGLIGANGAGKTTLIRIILGFEKQDDGEISIFEKSNLDVEIRKSIGYQSDLPFVARTMSVIDYLNMNSKLLGIADNSKQIISLLENFKLIASSSKKLSELSRGMRQKLEIINAFLGNPKLIILDEPTSALDPIATLELRDFLSHYTDKEATILFSSHHLSEVESICNSVIIIDNGIVRREIEMEGIQKGLLENEFKKIIESKEGNHNE